MTTRRNALAAGLGLAVAPGCRARPTHRQLRSASSPRNSGPRMDHFARLGYDVWTMDHEGYGHSQKTAGNSDIQSGVEDLKAAMAVIEKSGGPLISGHGASQPRLAFFGQSSGALRAARFANQYPDHVEKLALDAFVWTGKDAPTLEERRKNLPRYQAANRRPVSREFYRSVFTRDHSGAAEPMLGDIVADEELGRGPISF